MQKRLNEDDISAAGKQRPILTSSESLAGRSSFCSEHHNCVTSPQDAEGCNTEQESEMNIM